MRILLFSISFAPLIGGMERFAEDLSEWLQAQGHEVTVATWTPDERERDAARPYEVLRQPDWSQLLRRVRRSDVLHLNGLALRGLVHGALVGSPIVVTHTAHQAICPTGMAWADGGTCTADGKPGPCQVCPGRGLTGDLKVRTHRAGAFCARRNVLISSYQRRRLALPNDQVIYNPVARRAFEALSPGPGTPGLVAFAGRLVAEKGVDHLLRALLDCPDARLEIAGDGDQRANLDRLVRDLGLQQRVRFLGALPTLGVAELYARAAVVCVPSLWHEPFGYSAAEAMAMQRPVVATPSGALVELLADGRGYVASDMQPGSLGAALAHALSDEETRERTAAYARDFAEKEISIDMVGPKYAEIYREAVA